MLICGADMDLIELTTQGNDLYARAVRMMIAAKGWERHPHDSATGRRVRAPEGEMTIGVGRNIDKRPLSDQVLLLILQEDIEQAISDAQDVVTAPVWDVMSDGRKLVLILLAFDLGAYGLLQQTKLIRAIRQLNWPAAAQAAASLPAANVRGDNALRITRALKAGEWI